MRFADMMRRGAEPVGMTPPPLKQEGGLKNQRHHTGAPMTAGIPMGTPQTPIVGTRQPIAPRGGNTNTALPSPAGTNPYMPQPSTTPMTRGGITSIGQPLPRPIGTPGQGGISPVDVAPTEPNYGEFERFSDAAYDEASRYLDPERERREDGFKQDLINRGIDPNSEAGLQALDRHNRGLNDLERAASFGALQEGRSFQDQLFGQNLAESTLANQLEQARMAAEASVTSSRAAAAASRYGSDRGLEGLRLRTDEDGRQFDLGLGQRESEFGRNMDFDRDRFTQDQYQFDRQADFAEMMGYASVDEMYADLGLRERALDQQDRRDQTNDIWRFLAGLPSQNVGPWGPDTRGAAQGVSNGTSSGTGIAAMWPGG